MERHALLRMGGFSLCHSKVIGVRHRELDFRSVLDEGDDASPNGRRVRQGKAAFYDRRVLLGKSRFYTVSRALYAVPHLVFSRNTTHCVEVP